METPKHVLFLFFFSVSKQQLYRQLEVSERVRRLSSKETKEIKET